MTAFSREAQRQRICPGWFSVWLLAILSVLAMSLSGFSARAQSAPDPLRPKRKLKAPTPTPTPMALPADITIPQYKPGEMPFHDGEQLVFQASWIGIRAAQARLVIHRNPKDPNVWTAEVWLETSKLVDVIYKMRDYVAERFEVGSLNFQKMYVQQSEKKRFAEFMVDFDPQKNLVTQVKRNRKGSNSRQFIAHNPVGPVSGSLMALSQPLDPGSTLVFDVFGGSVRVVFSFHVEARERVNVPMGTFDAFRISPSVVYLSDGSWRSEARETMLWVSADKRRLPLRAETAAFFGVVRADLIQVDGKPP
ncbi:MAG TPA: DUF3108 domain-containing protein, partial [Candidatus Binataceae bacterium]